jgi:putative effector of murein hydrolase
MSPQLPEIREIWVYLSGSPLLALTLTLAAWELGTLAYEKSGRNPLVNPVAIAVAAVAATIVAIGMPYATYFAGAQFVHFLLGTATVALAVPIHRGLDALRGRVVPLVAALLGGGTVSIATALGAARLFGVDAPLQQGLWAKSVTAPIAMGVAERIGASPTLTAVYAVVTGVLGAALGRFVLDAVGCRAWWQRGAAIGIAAHGIGTSRAFNVHPEAGAWASLAMGLHGVIGAVLIPLVLGR